MNQNDQLVFKSKDEKRIKLSLPIHSILNWFHDRKIEKREKAYAQYAETVQDYVQDQ